jgi:diguanylate cyclase (GGDEF)-like protein
MTIMIIAYLLISLRRSIQLERVSADLRVTTEDLHRNVGQIAHMARHDALTGLSNRLVFRERIEEAIARHRRGVPFAILYLDLDHFKAVNDTLGHGAGDRLLCVAAARISGCLREVDTVARLGGDEFALILTDKANPEAIAHVADRLIREVGKPYTIEEHTVVVGVSIGIASPTTGDATAENVLKEADLALYEAKNAGHGTYRFFETRLRTQFEAKKALEHDVRRGLDRGEFELYYQPTMNLVEDRVTGFEALLRWNHPEYGLLPPDRFVALAEECGLIVPLGLWALRTACEQAAHWPAPVKVAVNVSPLHFKSDDLVASVLRSLSLSGLPAQRLEIEITEAAVLNESATTFAVLDELRTVGVSIAFDDFGTGFSSLSSLLRFPFDKLKIDRSFLAALDTSESSLAIVRAIVGLGRNLRLVTTGEGVETLEQLAKLRELGCTEAQGYLFSRPRPNRDVPRLLRELGAHATGAIDAAGA